MSRITETLKRISKFLIAANLILTLGFFTYQPYFSKYFPLSTRLEIESVYPLILLFFLILLLPTVFASTRLEIIRVSVFVLGIPYFCLCAFVSVIIPEKILVHAKIGASYYYVTDRKDTELDIIYTIYKCNTNSLECEVPYAMETKISGNIELIVDKKMDEFHLLKNGYPIYADGKKPRLIIESQQFENFIYYIGVYPPDIDHFGQQRTFMLYKCETTFQACEKIPFNYVAATSIYDFQLEFDDEKKEIKIYEQSGDEDTLIFSLNSNP